MAVNAPLAYQSLLANIESLWLEAFLTMMMATVLGMIAGPFMAYVMNWIARLGPPSADDVFNACLNFAKLGAAAGLLYGATRWSLGSPVYATTTH